MSVSRGTQEVPPQVSWPLGQSVAHDVASLQVKELQDLGVTDAQRPEPSHIRGSVTVLVEPSQIPATHWVLFGG